MGAGRSESGAGAGLRLFSSSVALLALPPCTRGLLACAAGRGSLLPFPLRCSSGGGRPTGISGWALTSTTPPSSLTLSPPPRAALTQGRERARTSRSASADEEWRRRGREAGRKAPRALACSLPARDRRPAPEVASSRYRSASGEGWNRVDRVKERRGLARAPRCRRNCLSGGKPAVSLLAVSARWRRRLSQTPPCLPLGREVTAGRRSLETLGAGGRRWLSGPGGLPPCTLRLPGVGTAAQGEDAARRRAELTLA